MPSPELLESQLFACTGLRPADVDAVFVTHWHGDHRLGLLLFEDKPWLMAAQGNAILRGVIVENRSRRQAMLAKVVVGASGDGDVAARAGAGGTAT